MDDGQQSINYRLLNIDHIAYRYVLGLFSRQTVSTGLRAESPIYLSPVEIKNTKIMSAEGLRAESPIYPSPGQRPG